MKITILTIFPEMFTSFLDNSIIKRAIAKGLVSFNIINIRDYTLDKHHRTDNPPVGGGAGLIMIAQPIIDALKANKGSNSKIIFPSPRGVTFKQNDALNLSKEEDLVFICGHYEGIDERVLDYVDYQYSLGDFILTGGEIPTQAMADAIIRLIPGVIAEDSVKDESFNEEGLLEYPQYTLPEVFEDKRIPDILFSGNHTAINKWRKKKSLFLTKKLRPDLFEKYKLTKQDQKLLDEGEDSIPDWEAKAIEKGKKFIK